MLGSQKTLAELEGKTITLNGKQPGGAGLIWAHLGRTPDGQKLPKTQIFPEYTMKLEFGKAADGKLAVELIAELVSKVEALEKRIVKLERGS